MSGLAAAVAALRAGGLVVHPTETVYGIGTALSAGEPGLVRVRRAKRCAPGRPFLLLASDEEEAFALWAEVTAAARDLARRAWPGPLTLVGPAGCGLPPSLLGRERYRGSWVHTLSVRVPGDPFVRELLAALGEPIVSTSANVSGMPPPATFAEVDLEALAPDLAIDRGRCPAGTPSTVLSVLTDPPTLLRAGAWPWP